MADDFDPKKHDTAKLKFLETLYLGVKENPSSLSCKEADIAESVGLSQSEARRLSQELKDEGLIAYIAGGSRGPSTALTRSGLERIRNHLYEKTPLAKRRKLWKATKGKAAEWGGKWIGEAIKWGAIFVAGWLTSHTVPRYQLPPDTYSHRQILLMFSGSMQTARQPASAASSTSSIVG